MPIGGAGSEAAAALVGPRYFPASRPGVRQARRRQRSTARKKGGGLTESHRIRLLFRHPKRLFVRANPTHHPVSESGDSAPAREAGDRISMVVDGLAPHARTILAGGVAVLVAAAGWIMISSQSDAARGRSWDAYLAAMAAVASGEPADAAFQDVTQRHPGTAAADWSRLRMAEIRIAGGTEAAFRDKAAAARDFEAAAEILSELLATRRPRGLLAEQATFALAKARESLGDFDQARKGYETVVREHPQGPTAEAARRRAEALARGSLSQWYAWFSAQDPVAAAPDAAATGSEAAAPPASGAAPAVPSGEETSDEAGKPGADAGGKQTGDTTADGGSDSAEPAPKSDAAEPQP
jgi:TolA-binding protein